MSPTDLTEDPYVAAFPELVSFWDAAKRGVLALPRCVHCGEAHWHPRAHCPYCNSVELRWEEASGRGTLHTFTIVRRTESAYALAYVKLDEGPLMLTNIVGTEFERLYVGMQVQVLFQQAAEGRRAPVFRELRGASAHQ